MHLDEFLEIREKMIELDFFFMLSSILSRHLKHLKDILQAYSLVTDLSVES